MKKKKKRRVVRIRIFVNCYWNRMKVVKEGVLAFFLSFGIRWNVWNFCNALFSLHLIVLFCFSSLSILRFWKILFVHIVLDLIWCFILSIQSRFHDYFQQLFRIERKINVNIKQTKSKCSNEISFNTKKIRLQIQRAFYSRLLVQSTRQSDHI